MAKEREQDIEEWFAERKKGNVFQNEFRERPAFVVQELFETSRADLQIYQRLVEQGKIKPGTRTNISEIEIIYPWLLEKYGKINKLVEKVRSGENSQKASLFGDKLHRADTLFSIVTQGYMGQSIWEVLPTAKKNEIERYDEATCRLSYGKIKSKEDMAERLGLAWTAYHLDPEVYKVSSQEVLPGFGVQSNHEKKDIFYSKEIHAMGAKLAESWIEEYFSDDPLTWEFRKDAFSQREITISLRFSVSALTFNGRLDGVTRLLRDKKKRKMSAQIIDLKTGNKTKKTGIEAEILKRQQQVMQIMAERFTGKFLKGFNSLKPNKPGIFTMSVVNSGRVFDERLNLAGYRRLDKETGKMTLEPFLMTEEDRKEFDSWIIWYGNMVNLHKEEIKKLKKRKPDWDLENS